MILSESGRAVTAAALGLPGDLTLPDLPEAAAPTSEPESAAGPAVTDADGAVLRLEELEKHAIRAALRQTAGNRTQAAAALGISIRTLRNKLQEYRDAGDPVDVDLDATEA